MFSEYLLKILKNANPKKNNLKNFLKKKRKLNTLFFQKIKF